MADKYDGSLIFNAKLDTSEFEKDLEKLKDGVKKAEKQTKGAGKSAGSGLEKIDTGKSQKALDDLGKKAEETARKVDDIGKKVDTSHAEKALDGLGKKAEETAKEVEKATAQAEKGSGKAGGSLIGTDAHKKALAEFQKATKKFNLWDFTDQYNSEGKQLALYKTLTPEELIPRLEEQGQVVDELRQKLEDLRAATSSDDKGELYNVKHAERALSEMEGVLAAAQKQAQGFSNTLQEATKPDEKSEQPVIKVPTEVDTQGLDAGTEETKKAVESLRDKFAQVGQQIAANAKASFEQFSQSARNAVSGAFISNSPNLKTLEDAQKIAKDMVVTAKELAESGKDINADNITKYAEFLAEYEKQVFAYGETHFQADGQIFQGKDTGEGFEDIVQVVAVGRHKLEEEFAKLNPDQQIDVKNALLEQALKRFHATAAQIKDITTPQEGDMIINQLKGQMDAFENSPFATSEGFNDMNRIIEEESAEIEQLREKWNATHQSVSAFEQAVADGNNRAVGFTDMLLSGITRVSNALAQGTGHVMGFFSAFTSPAKAADIALGAIASAAGRAAKGLLNLAITGARTAAEAVKRLGIEAAKTAANLARMAVQNVTGAFKKLGSAILGIGGATSKMNGGFNLSLGTILKYGFGIRSLYFLFNKLRRAFMDGFNTMMQGDAQLKATVDSFKQSLENLKLSFASAFAPIAQVVLPAITQIINAIANAISYVGMFMSALTGKATFKRAVANVNGVTNATNAAGNAAKEAKRQLAGFDKLEILSDNSGSGGGGGGGAGGGGPTFEDVPIESGIADFVQNLKDMWANADYEGIGAAIADVINKAFAKVDELIKWDNVGGTITKYVDAFCRIFNSLVDNIDWALIGKTFADGANTLLHTIDLLLTGIDWKNLGRKFSDGLNSFVDNIEWGLLGKTLADKLGARLMLIYGVLDNFDFANLGTKLAQGINSFFATLSDYVNRLDFKKIGRNLAAGVNNLAKGVDTEKAFKTLGDGLEKAIRGITTFIEGVNWQELGHKLKEGLAAVNWAGLAEAIAEGIGAALGGLAGIIWGFIRDGVIGIKQYFDSSIEDAGGNVAKGILNGIVGIFKKVGSWVKKNILDPFIKGFKKAFGIKSPATNADLLEAAGYVGEGILNGIAAVFANIAGWVKEHILKPITDILDKAKMTVKVGLEKAKTWAGDVWDVIKSGAQTIKKTISAKIEQVGEWSADILTAFKAGSETITKKISAVIEKAGDWADEAWQALKGGKEEIQKTITVGLQKASNWNSDVMDALSAAKQKAGDAVETTVTLVKDGWDSLSNFIGTSVKVYVGLAKNGWESLTQWIGNSLKVWVGLAKNGWESLTAWIGNALTVFVGLAKNGWDSITAWIGNALKVWVSLAKNGWESLSKWIGNALKVWVSLAKNGWRSLSSWIGTTLKVWVSLVKNGWRSLSSWIGTKISVGVELFKKGSQTLWNLITGRASGGVYQNGRWSSLPQFAGGGSIYNGIRRFWDNIPQFAGGGSLFVAGEAGPEIVGHIGGRSEVLNQSQLASTMYYAVRNGMGEIANALGSAIIAKMAESANAEIRAMDAIASQVAFVAPAMSSGTVMPYAITKADLEEVSRTIEASNEELQSVLVQAIAGAANLIVGAVREIDTGGGVDMDMITKKTIADINRRTLMFGTSPLR